MKFNYSEAERTIEIGEKSYPLKKRTVSLLNQISEIDNDDADETVKNLHNEYDILVAIMGEAFAFDQLGTFEETDLDKLDQLYRVAITLYNPNAFKAASNESAD